MIDTITSDLLSVATQMGLKANFFFSVCFISSGMLALALDDFSLLVVDIEMKRVVRRFAGHHGNVNGMVSLGLQLQPPCSPLFIEPLEVYLASDLAS